AFTRSAKVSVPAWLFVTGLLAALFPAFNCLQRGQMGIALVYPLLLGFRLLWLGEAGRERLAGGILMALPVALKLTPVLPAACALGILVLDAVLKPDPEHLTGRPRDPARVVVPAFGFVAGCLVFFLLLPAGLVGWNANLRHLHTWYVRV